MGVGLVSLAEGRCGCQEASSMNGISPPVGCTGFGRGQDGQSSPIATKRSTCPPVNGFRNLVLNESPDATMPDVLTTYGPHADRLYSAVLADVLDSLGHRTSALPAELRPLRPEW